MNAKLFCKFGPFKGRSFEITGEASIGRQSDNDIRLDHPSISSRHARIVVDEARRGYVLEDLGSTNGTVLDGVRVTEPQPIGRLHVINFGGVADFFFQAQRSAKSAPAKRAHSVSDTHDGPSVAKIPTVIRKLSVPDEAVADRRRQTQDQPLPVSLPAALVQAISTKTDGSSSRGDAAASSPTEPELTLIVDLLNEQRAYPLRPGEHIVGRSSKASIQIPSDEISRRHARLTVHDSGIRIADLGSTNGTFIEDRKLEGEQSLQVGQAFAFGKIKARLAQSTPRSGS